MANPDLVRFILEAKRRKFSDSKIKEVLLSNKWPSLEIDKAFNLLEKPHHFKESITIWLDSEIIKKLEKRAKRNMLNVNEQIEDIVRRSIINQKQSQKSEKLDDMLVGLFSRKQKK